MVSMEIWGSEFELVLSMISYCSISANDIVSCFMHVAWWSLLLFRDGKLECISEWKKIGAAMDHCCETLKLWYWALDCSNINPSPSSHSNPIALESSIAIKLVLFIGICLDLWTVPCRAWLNTIYWVLNLPILAFITTSTFTKTFPANITKPGVVVLFKDL